MKSIEKKLTPRKTLILPAQSNSHFYDLPEYLFVLLKTFLSSFHELLYDKNHEPYIFAKSHLPFHLPQIDCLSPSM